jgi:pilus assembly protein Flp/PilA
MKLFLATTHKLVEQCKRVLRRDEGAALVEYALLVGLIAVVCIAAITLLGTNISDLFNRIAAKLTGIGT